MPTAPDNHDAHDYAERIRERLPWRLQEGELSRQADELRQPLSCGSRGYTKA